MGLPMKRADVWKLGDAKARFSELVRRARAGEPQQVTVRGKQAVLVLDPERYHISAKPSSSRTQAGFVRRSRKYKLDVDVDFERPTDAP